MLINKHTNGLIVVVLVVLSINGSYVSAISINQKVELSHALPSISHDETTFWKKNSINNEAVGKISNKLGDISNNKIKQSNNGRDIVSRKRLSSQSYVDYNEAIKKFNPEINVTGEYIQQNVTGNINANDTNFIFNNEGEYTVEGNISDLYVQYFTNPSAEENTDFLGNESQYIGIPLYRQQYNMSLDGQYAWKYSNNQIESDTTTFYQRNIKLYEGNMELSYHLLFEENSTIKDIANTSIMFNFVFNTFSIVVYNWYYTNVETIGIGDNSTTGISPTIVLLKNISWDGLWHSIELNISDIADSFGIDRPQEFLSLAIIVSSPIQTNASFLLDKIQLKSLVTPEQIALKANSTLITNVPSRGSMFNININQTEIGSVTYEILWYHNSTYEISGIYQIRVKGEILLPSNKSISISAESIKYYVSIENISLSVETVNITYPNYWIICPNQTLYETINIVSSTNFVTRTLKVNYDFTTINCTFIIPNLINNTYYTSTLNIFETLNLTIISEDSIDNYFTILFYNYTGSEVGTKLSVYKNNAIFTFPAYIPRGYYNVTILSIGETRIGYLSFNVHLLRYPADLQVVDSLVIPQYASKQLKIEYLSLDPKNPIVNASLVCNLENETLNIEKTNDSFLVLISAYYLEPGTYQLHILAKSGSHSTIKRDLVIIIEESDIKVSFTYKFSSDYESCIFLFHITSGDYAVSYAPLFVTINQSTTVYGASDILGNYNVTSTISPLYKYISIDLNIIKITQVIVKKSFTIEFNKVHAYISRDNVETILQKNITLQYSIHYTTEAVEWFSEIDEEMLPILEAYVETNSYRYPVFLQGNIMYWRVAADENTTDHKLIIITSGVSLSASFTKQNKDIKIEFVITSQVKTISKLSVIYYFNNTLHAKDYIWKLITINKIDMSNAYNLTVNDLYVYFTNVNVTQGSYLLLQLLGKYTSTLLQNNIVFPVVLGVTGTSVIGLLVWKVYMKKRSLILTI